MMIEIPVIPTIFVPDGPLQVHFSLLTTIKWTGRRAFPKISHDGDAITWSVPSSGACAWGITHRTGPKG